jgi:hypothetical protein
MVQSRLSSTGTLVAVVTSIVGLIVGYLSLAAAVKWAPFDEPVRHVVVSKGDNAVGVGNCVALECAYIAVDLKGFEAGATVQCTFDSSAGSDVFGNYVAKVDSEGSLHAQTTNYFGNDGGWVSATCDETTGVLNPW